MTEPLNILAASEDEMLVKVVFGVIFFIIWAVSAAVSSVSKRQQEQRRRMLAGEQSINPFTVASGQIPIPPKQAANPFATVSASAAPKRGVAAQQRPIKPLKQAVQKSKQQKRIAIAPRKAPTSIPAIPQAAAVRSQMTAPPTPTTHLAGGSAGSTTAISGTKAADSMLVRLLRPNSIRTLVITNELLQPPLALRDAPHL